MPERTDNDGVVKKRQPMSKTNSMGGYSTDESGDSASAPYSRTDKKRRGGKRPDGGGDSGGKASVIWLVLVIGLIFCLMDAAYIARVLDRGPTLEDGEAKNMELLKEIRRQTHNFGAGHSHDRVLNRQDFSDADVYSAKTGKKIHSAKEGGVQRVEAKQAPPGAKRARQEREALREKERAAAEQQRIINVKQAALEALKADHGGKLPEDMIDLADEESFKPKPIAEYEAQAEKDDKKFIIDLFIDAGLTEMDDSTYRVLPTWKDVSELYGTEPKILGLEQCETFRAKGNPWDHFVSTAGTFNSGTNLMAEMLIHNCHMEERMKKLGKKNRGIRWQVPWGKHTPPGNDEYRLEHKSLKDKDVDANMIIPAVTVRDPYYWMQSMCKHHYTASWRPSDRCPNLIPLAEDKANYPMLRDKDFFPLTVTYADFKKHHQSLTGLWNDWYAEYKGVDFQRLFVRYEDLLFYPKHVTETVCKCAGGTMFGKKFTYQVDSAKKGVGAHGKVRTGYVDAIIKYGTERHRYNGYHPEDLKYAREHLDDTMMTEMGYKYHPMDLETGDQAGGAGENGGNEEEDNPEEVGDANKEHAEEKEAPEVPEDEEAKR